MFILDCTLRDGGYYNNWDFDLVLVSQYFRTIEAINVDAVEIGFRLPEKNRFIGAFGYCAEQFLNTLELPKCKLGVMINANESSYSFLQENFVKCNDSYLDFVRIATHFSTLSQTIEAANYLKTLGYTICVNLMQIASKTSKEIRQAIKQIVDESSIDVLYFADSFGNLNERSVRSIIEDFRVHWPGPIGAHCHNNKNIALQNTLCALDNGAEWLDSTMLGMGRGAGNTRTEELLIELSSRSYDYRYEPVMPLILEIFEPLQKKYKWGTNLLYYLSAIYDIHPTYVQKLLENYSSTSQVLSAIQSLKNAKSFKEDILHKAMLGETDVRGSWSMTDHFRDKNVLIVAPGDSVSKYREAIVRFISETTPVVINLNINTQLPTSLIDIYAICHYSRILTEIDQYKPNSDSCLLAPARSIALELQKDFSTTTIMDYGIKIQAGTFEPHDKYCIIPSLLVFAYVLAAVAQGNARAIWLVGFDGFPNDLDRETQVKELINLFKQHSEIPMTALTPTRYNVEQSSIFYPRLAQ